MNDTMTYVLIGVYSLSTFAVLVWLLKQLMIVIRYFVRIYVAESKKIENLITDNTTDHVD